MSGLLYGEATVHTDFNLLSISHRLVDMDLFDLTSRFLQGSLHSIVKRQKFCLYMLNVKYERPRNDTTSLRKKPDLNVTNIFLPALGGSFVQ